MNSPETADLTAASNSPHGSAARGGVAADQSAASNDPHGGAASGASGAFGWDVPAAWTVVPFRTVPEILVEAAGRRPGAAALVFEDGLVVTTSELLELVEEFAGFLRERIQPGDCVSIMLTTRAEFMVAWLAVVACRGILVSINPASGAVDAGHILRDSRSAIAIVGREQAALVDRLRDDCPALREVIVVDAAEPYGLRAYAATEPHGLRAYAASSTQPPRSPQTPPEHPFPLAEAACERDDITNIYYTSGTTGAPKGCMIDHEYWLRVLDVDLRLHPKGPSDRQLCCLQFFYNDPAWQLLAALVTGGALVVMRRFSVSRFWDVVRDNRVTEILAIASMPILLLKAPPSPRDREHLVKRALQVAVPANLHAQMTERWGFPWIDGYGITESGFVSRVPLAQADELIGSGSIGIACPEVELRLLDDAGNPVAAGETGEFVMRAPGMMRGYFNRPDATAEVMREGWFFTGDLGREDERGLLYFVGRKKDMIRRSGENVAAAEVEAVLRSHSGVLEVAVVPVPDELRGEEIKAYVQPVPGRTLDTLPPAELVAYCLERLAPHKVPRYFEYRTVDFPRTPTMRVRKEVLHAEAPTSLAPVWDREREQGHLSGRSGR